MEDHPVIVGMACRVPGAQNPSKLWDNIIAKKDIQRRIPADRFNIGAFYHPDNAHKGTTNQQDGYFLDDPVDLFDAEFFGISGKEAEAMDPQQRLLLEVVYEALEDASITLDEISGSNTSVFVGSLGFDYAIHVSRDIENNPRHSLTGQGNALLSNRISFFYNLHGPSITVDTACSSSLVTFHMGTNSILSGESDISIVMGAGLLMNPGFYTMGSDMGFFSSDGRCRSFDAHGTGYARGEGVCVVVLKRQSLAIEHRNDIRAVVRATETNHDGKKTGITVPSSKAQEAMIRSAYLKAGLNPDDTQYIEAHGTGTKVGDPAEAKAIAGVFCTPTRLEPLYFGSVKSNIGHLEGAAGLAGVIKATLALEKGRIPPNMHFNTPHPEIKFSEWKLRVPTEEVDWPITSTGVRRASCSSFGFGGANAHAILESYRDASPEAIIPKNGVSQVFDPAQGRPYLIPLTAHTLDSAKLAVNALVKYVETSRGLNAKDLAHSLSYKRSMHRFRSFAIGTSPHTVRNHLKKVLITAKWNTVSADQKSPRLGFVFTGQGAQAYDMGRQLIEQSPLFRKTLEKCDRVLSSLPDRPNWSLVAEFLRSKKESRVSEAAFSQPMCTCLQLALVDLLASWGIHPAAVCGHSSGEVAAAYSAGILPFEAAVVVSYYRGLHMSRAEGKPGAMMAVGLGEKDIAPILEPFVGRLVIAAINSPSGVTVSGDADAIDELAGSLSASGIFARRLEVQQAFHSHHMLPLAATYQDALERCERFTVKGTTCRMFSSVTSRVADSDTMGAPYWAENMVRPVQFKDALTGILLDEDEDQIVDILVEIGPHPALKGPSREVLDSLKIEAPHIATLSRNRAAYESLLDTVGQLFALGHTVDLNVVNKDQYLVDTEVMHVSGAKKLKDLPSYSWSHKSFWAETRLLRQFMHKDFRHTLLGAVLPGSTEKAVTFRTFMRLSELPWLSGHELDDAVVFPGSGYVCLAVEGAVRMRGSAGGISRIRFQDVDIKSPMVLRESEQGTEVLVDLRPLATSARTVSDDWLEFNVSSYNETGQFAEHCHGFVAVETGRPGPLRPLQDDPAPRELLASSSERMSASLFYSYLEKIGLHYGADFRLVKDHIVFGKSAPGRGFSLGEIQYEPGRYTVSEIKEHTILHPALLDAALHIIWLAASARFGGVSASVYVPRSLKSLEISGYLVDPSYYSEMNKFMVTARSRQINQRETLSDNIIWSADGSQVLVEGRDWDIQAVGFRKDDHAGTTLFFQERWAPYFDLIASEATLPVEVKDVHYLIDLFVFQHPSAKILYVASSPADIGPLLECLQPGDLGRPLYEVLHVFIPGTDEQGQHDLGERFGITVCSPNGSYDLIAATSPNFSSDIVSPDHLQINTTLVTKNKIMGFEMLETVQIGQVYLSRRQRVSRDHNMTVILRSQTVTSERTSSILLSLGASSEEITTMDMGFVSSGLDGKQTNNDIVVLASLDGDIEAAQEWISVRHLLGLEHKNIVWVVEDATLNPTHAKIRGLLKTARNENPQSRIVTLDIEKTASASHVAKRIRQALSQTLEEDEIMDRNGCAFIPRLEEDVSRNRKLPNTPGNVPSTQNIASQPPMQLTIAKIRLLETLCFEPNRELINNAIGENEVEIKVMASALNFRDVAIATGIIQDWGLGNECAGIVTAVGVKVDPTHFTPGDRVLAYVKGALATVVRPDQRVCRRIPDGVSFSTASSFLSVLTTAIYALFDIGRLRKGEVVLVHAAAGGVGQVAVQLAQRAGARVLATCSESKRAFLKEQFGLQDSQIFSSRDESFVRGVMKATNGRGIDVVLNSLSDKLLRATWSCIGWFGRFVEIGKRDIHQNSNLAMEPFRKNATFSAVDMVTVFEKTPHVSERLMDEACKLVFDGEISVPQSLLEVPFSEVERAFRLLQLGKHIGKIILVPRQEHDVRVAPPMYAETIGTLFDASKTYLLVGGLGGLGSAVAEWMFAAGARRFAFLCRSGSKSSGGSTLDWLRSKGAVVAVYEGDVAILADVERVVDKIGSLGGVFHAAAVLRDSSIRTMSFTQWETCLKVKCDGAWNLHTATSGQKLEFFTCFSSVSAVIGNPGQANYNAANAYLDSLMKWRRHQGLVGTSINIAAVSSVGMFADRVRNHPNATSSSQLETITPAELMYLIEEAILSEQAFSNSSPENQMIKQLITGLSTKNTYGPLRLRSAFRVLYANSRGVHTAEKRGKSLQRLLAASEYPEERASILQQGFIEKVSAVLDVPAQSITPENPLSLYGLDSIVAVELRRWFKDTIEVDLRLFDLLGPRSIAAIVNKALAAMPRAVVTNNAPDVNGTTSALTNGETQLIAPAKPDQDPIPHLREKRPVPCSALQARILSCHYDLEERWRLNASLTTTFQIQDAPEKITAELLRESLVHLAHHHPILKTSFLGHGDFPVQKELEKPYPDILVAHNLTNDEDPEVALQELVRQQRRQTLKFEDGQVFQGTWVKLPDAIHVLILVLHRLVVDDKSIQLVGECWNKVCEAMIGGKEPDDVVPFPPITYTDFALWEHTQLHGDSINPHRQFWESYLGGAQDMSRLLPHAQVAERPATFAVDTARHFKAIPANLGRRMRRQCASYNATPLCFLLMAFRVFLYRLTGEEDLVLCLLDETRPHPDTHDVVGFFTNAIPLRLRLSEKGDSRGRFVDHIKAGSAEVAEAMLHGVVPFNQIAAWMGAEARPGVTPVAQIAFHYKKTEAALVMPDKHGVNVIRVEVHKPSVVWDFVLDVLEGPEGQLKLGLEHSLALYTCEDMQHFLEQFSVFLTSLIKDQYQEITEVVLDYAKAAEHLEVNGYK